MNLRYRILGETDGRNGCTEDSYQEVLSFLERQKVEIVELAWFCVYWQVRVAGDIDRTPLPGYIQKTAIFYHMDETSAEEHTAQHTKTCEGIKETSNPFQLRLFDRLTIDTPSTRQLEGQILAVAKKRVHCEGPAGYQWMEQIWCWFGQEAIDVEESHGVPLRDSEGHVLVSFVVLTVTILGLWIRYRDSWKMVSALVKGGSFYFALK